MKFFAGFYKSDFFIKLLSWEYWPFGIIQAPAIVYWLWLSIKARTPVFFSASNPGIAMGGMFGESKSEILGKVPASCKPATILVPLPVTLQALLLRIREAELRFPLIFKPDLGERGWMVKKIDGEEEAGKYLNEIKVDFIVQEFIELPLEFGVFYVRYPNEPKGEVISIVGKEMLSVEGDGRKTLRELILGKERARLQWETLRRSFRDRLDEVLSTGEKLELVSIGNHCLGTRFINCNHLITEKLSDSFDQISKSIEGFYFGRYDLRVASLHDLEHGRVKVVELNGCGAEPAHIYDPSFSLWEALPVLVHHWGNIYRISKENHLRGVPYISLREARIFIENSDH